MNAESLTTLVAALASTAAVLAASVSLYWYKREQRAYSVHLDRLTKYSHELEDSRATPQVTKDADPLFLAELAEVAPDAAVIAASHVVERAIELRKRLPSSDLDAQDLPRDLADIARELRELRNSVVHRSAPTIDSATAIRLVLLAHEAARRIENAAVGTPSSR